MQKRNKAFDSAFSILQKVGQSLMVPVSVLPAAGLIVALGRLLTQVSKGSASGALLPSLGELLFQGGLAIFEMLPVVFAIGVAIGFTGGAGIAGLASVAGYFTLVNVLKTMGTLRALPLAINTGVFGGIITGLVTAAIYQRFYQTKLPPVLGFFSGKRLVPIVTVGTSILLGIAMGFLWPPIQDAINHVGLAVMGSTFGPGFYAAGKRLLIPVGLHHVFYPPFLYQFGDFVTSTGQVLHGESARYFAGDHSAGRFMASEFPLMLFGLPAASFAMYLRARKENRKAVGGVMLTAALTSILTGITEPIEFSFLFVAPALFVFHVAAAFLSGLLTGYFDIHLGYTFSASAIDYALGFFNQQNSQYLFLIVGPVIALLYFGVFYSLIGWLDLKTPGRSEEEGETATASLPSQKALNVLKALGGARNLKQLDACITRLRLSVENTGAVDRERLKELGAAGVLDAGGGNLQVVFGVESDLLKEEIKKIIASGKNDSAPTLKSPLSGKLLSLDDVPDAVFKGRTMGDGFAIEPDGDTLFSPVDAKVAHVFPTFHAIGLETADGMEILLHVGIDTVKMEGRGFKAFVSAGDHVKAGDKLIQFDRKLIVGEGKATITPITIMNMDKVASVGHPIDVGTTVRVGDAVLEVQLKAGG